MPIVHRVFAVIAFCCAAMISHVAQAQNYSDIWWNPNESGWGITLADHDTQLFGVWYTYDTNGNPTWYVIQGEKFTQAKRFFSGDIYQTAGPAYNTTFNTNLVSNAKVGTASFDFASPGLAPGIALFTYTVGSITQTKQIQRQPFGNAAADWGADYTDIWWNAKESGWGLTLAQHGNNVFGVWFTYDTSGKPLWVVLPGVTFNGISSFSGTLYTTTGPYFASIPFNPASVVIKPVGAASIKFTGRDGTFTSTVNGYTQTKPITSQPFGNPPVPAGVSTLTTLSTMATSPFASLSIFGTGLTQATSAVSVKFIPGNGNPAIIVPVSTPSSTALQVMVPPLFDPTSGGSISGVVDVQVIQVSGSTLTTSNLIKGLQIAALRPVPTGTPVGARTAAFLNFILEAFSRTQTLLSSNPALSPIAATSPNYKSNLSMLISAINTITINPNTSASFSAADGSTVTLDAKTLAISDQTVQALVAELASKTQVAAAVSISEPNRIGSIRMSIALASDTCPLYPNDPIAYDTNLCHVQRFFQNLTGENPAVTAQMTKALASAAAGVLPVPKFMADQIVASAMWTLSYSLLTTGATPPGGDVVEGVAITTLDTWGRTSGMIGFTVDAFNIFRLAATTFPARQGAAPVAMAVSDPAGNTYLLRRDGTTLVTVPTSQGSFPIDSLTLVGRPPVLPTPAKANLTPYQPTGWSDKIVVARTSGVTTNSADLLTSDTLYVNWAVLNNGTAATSVRNITQLYLDGVLINSWYDDPPTDPHFFFAVRNYSIGSLAPGNHTLRIVADATAAIDESDETDNEYTKTFSVRSPTTTTAAIAANPNSVSMTATSCYPAQCTVSKTITITSSTPWTSSPPGFGSLGEGFQVSPNTGPAGSTAVVISYTASVPQRANGFIRFRTTTTGVYVEVPVIVNVN